MKQVRSGSEVGTSGTSRGPPERQLNVMLVSVCVAFVCLRLPYTVSYALYEYTKDPDHPRSEAEELSYWLATQITDVIATTNYVVNFFLYGLCGSYFRQQVRAAFRCRRGRRGGWVAGRQRQFGSGYSTRTTDLATRTSVMSETVNLSTYRSNARKLPPIQD